MPVSQDTSEPDQHVPDLSFYVAEVRIGSEKLTCSFRFVKRKNHGEGCPVSLDNLSLANESFPISIDADVKRFAIQPAAEYTDQFPLFLNPGSFHSEAP